MIKYLNDAKSQSSDSSDDSDWESMSHSDIVNEVVVANDGVVRYQTKDDQSDDDDGD